MAGKTMGHLSIADIFTYYHVSGFGGSTKYAK